MPLFSNVERSEAEGATRDAGAALARAFSIVYEIFMLLEKERDVKDERLRDLKSICAKELTNAVVALDGGIKLLRSQKAWQGKVAWNSIIERVEDGVDARAVRMWGRRVFGQIRLVDREVSIELVLSTSIRLISEFKNAIEGYYPFPPMRMLERTAALVDDAYELQQLSFAATRIARRIQEALGLTK